MQVHRHRQTDRQADRQTQTQNRHIQTHIDTHRHRHTDTHTATTAAAAAPPTTMTITTINFPHLPTIALACSQDVKLYPTNYHPPHPHISILCN